jgi:hypothetical protein
MTQVFQSSWPLNHEMESFVMRTLVYAAHQTKFDFFPIWSVSDNNFFGGPFPLFYHKTFYLMSGLFQNLFNNNQLSIVMAVLFFLLLGSFFMHLLIYKLTNSWLISLFGGLVFIFSNYTFTNWFIRGAMAEFSMAMLFPLVLYLVYCFFVKRKHSFLLGLILGISFLSHSAVFYFLSLSLAPVLTVYLLIHKDLKKFFQIILGLSIPVIPYVFLIWQLQDSYGLNNILIYRPQNEFVPLINYFWDAEYSFGERWDDFTVAIDKVILLLIIVILLRLILVPKSKEKKLKIGNNYFKYYLLFTFVFFFTLQLSFSRVFYLHFPGAQFLQFPWRLLSLLIPILILFVTVALNQLFSKKTLLVIVSILLPFHLIAAPNFKQIQYPRMQLSNLVIDSNTNWVSEETGAYFPTGIKLPEENSNLYFIKSVLKNCVIQNGSYISGDLSRSFIFSCSKPERILFPLLYSNFYSILAKFDSQPTYQQIDFVNEDGYISILLPEGSGELLMAAPTMIRALGKLLF